MQTRCTAFPSACCCLPLLKLAGIVWDVLFALAFLPILGVPAIAQASGAYGLLCKVLFVLVLLMPKVWILLPKRGE